MSLYRPSGSKVYWMDFFFAGQRVRESTTMKSKTVAKKVEDKRKQDLRRQRRRHPERQEAPALVLRRRVGVDRSQEIEMVSKDAGHRREFHEASRFAIWQEVGGRHRGEGHSALSESATG